jgi:hypothetical protein
MADKQNKVNVYTLGQHGINRVKSPVHVLDGELLSAQNATVRPIEGQLAITKRDGMAIINSSEAAGALVSITNIPTLIFGEPKMCIPIVNNGWESAAWSPELSRFAMVGKGSPNKVAYSDDGIDWIVSTSPANQPFYDVTWCVELAMYVAVGIGTKVLTSPDGVTWTANTAVFGTWRGVAYSDTLNIFVAVGEGSAMSSPDAVTWTDRTTGFIGGMDLRKVVWVPPLAMFVAVASTNGSPSNVMTSTDGTTWTQRTSVSTSTWYSVAWSPELAILAATGLGGFPPTPQFMYSTDGINWSAGTVTDGNEFWGHAVEWSPELRIFFAAQEGVFAFQCATSEDGMNWNVVSPNCSQDIINDVTWSAAAERFLLVADNEMELIGYG